MNDRTILFDIETNGFLEVLTTIHCICTYEVETDTYRTFSPYHESVDAGLEYLRSATRLVAHNGIEFDIPGIQKVCPLWVTDAILDDTLVTSRLIYPGEANSTNCTMKRLDYAKVKRVAIKNGKWDPKKWGAKDRNRFRYPKYRSEIINDVMPGKLLGRHSLEAWGYRLGVLKGDFGKTTDWSTCTPEMVDYCLDDVKVLRALWEFLRSKNYSQTAIDLEQNFARYLQLQNANGLYFKQDRGLVLQAELTARRDELRSWFTSNFEGTTETTKTPEYYVADHPDLFDCCMTKPTKTEAVKTLWEQHVKPAGLKRKDIQVTAGPLRVNRTDFNPNSKADIARMLVDQGWQPESIGSNGIPTVDDKVLKGLDTETYKGVAEAIEWNRTVKRLGYLSEGKKSWMALVTDDGRVRGTTISNGTPHGRCAHRDPNPAQIPSRGEYGEKCRSCFGPRPGWVQMGYDASGIQARALGHYLEPFDGGEFIDVILHGDIHERNRELAGLSTRDEAKTWFYAFLFGAGPKKLGGRQKVDAFMSGFTGLDRLIKHLENTACKNCKAGVEYKWGGKRRDLKGHTWIPGLDGREIFLDQLRLVLNYKLTNFEAVIMKTAAALHLSYLQEVGMVHRVDFDLMAHVHDEAQLEFRTEDLAETGGELALGALKKAGEIHGSVIQIDGEFKVGTSWAECH